MRWSSRFSPVLFLVVVLLSVPLPGIGQVVWRERAVTLAPAGLPAGPVWLRSWLKVPDNMVDPAGSDLWRDSMTLTLQHLPGDVSVSLNGVEIIRAVDLPDEPRRFKVPKGILKKAAWNALVIRLQGTTAPQGLTVAPVFAGYFDEVRLERPWQLAMAEPAAAELMATSVAPVSAAYSESDFQPGTTVLQANPNPERGKFVSPEEALRLLKTEPDLIVEELLHEPEVAQPTQVSWDARGRLWVAQYRQYPYPAGVKMISRDKYYRSKYDRVPPPPPDQTPGADVISVHEDTDGDGRYDAHKQVLTGLNMANAVLTGHGGIWVMNPPYLVFYPDADANDVPDGPPEVRLQGFGLEDTHSVANGLAWGPDGWIYGAQGSTTTSRVTRPGLDAAGSPGVFVEGCMVWRYHPAKRLYEIFADGSGNTFGISFDAEGRLFTGHNGGDTRGWHHVQDGLYLKQGKDAGKFGPAPNPYAFGELPMMRSTHPVARFSHMTLMAEGTALPARWRGQFAAADPLHHNIVAAVRHREGSTFHTTDAGNFLYSDDLTFRPVYLANAPDGSLVVADFREEYIAHGQNYQSQIDPSTGRIYRLRGKDLPLEREVDLSRKTGEELVEMLSHPNVWQRQTAVRLLAAKPETALLLEAELAGESAHPALEALWALGQMGNLTEPLALRALHHPSPMVRAWTIRLLGDEQRLSPAVMEAISRLVTTEPDAEVRCQMLSTARRLGVTDALSLTKLVVSRSGDEADAFIPLMAWFVIESHCARDREAVLAWFEDAAFQRSPLVAKHLLWRIMRRFAEAGTRQEWVACATLLDRAPGAAERNALMQGFGEAFQGRSLPVLPEELMKALAAGGQMSVTMRVRQGEPAAMKEALDLIKDPKAMPADQFAVVRVFGEVKHPAAVPELLVIAKADGPVELRVAACTALQIYDDSVIAEQMLQSWTELPAPIQSASLNLLTSRPAWSRLLLEAVATGRVAKSGFSADVLGRLRLHRDDTLKLRLEQHFPATTPPASAALRPRIQQVANIIAANPGDPYKGEPLYMAKCAACHTLFFKGGRTGPDLTSYQRDDLGTMLVSIIDPNAEIREGFANHLVTTRDGRTLSGFLADQDAGNLVLRGFDGADINLRRDEIATLTPAGFSLMPPGLLEGMSDVDIQHLFAYLRQSQPITK
jgi:putative membrane-bound dehydrogenase-like protein